MAINIFDVQADKPKQAFDVVGRFRAGHQIGKRPQALSEFRVTSDDPAVVDKIAEMFGGTAQEWDNERQPYEVFTTAASVDVIVEKIFSSMTLWGRNAPIRKCDGATISYPEESKGESCECAKFTSMSDRKAAAERGTGCAPDIAIRFRLADAPDLGVFEYKTGSWSLARDIGDVERTLADLGDRATGTLTLTPVEFTTSEGQLRKFTKMVVDLKKSAPEEVTV